MSLAIYLPKLPFEQRKLIHDIRALHGLWLSPSIYRKTFCSSPTKRWSLQSDGCKACMLARVGVDAEALVQLRTVLVARRKKQRPKPRLLGWVESWIIWHASAREIMTESDQNVRALRKACKKVWETNKETKRRTAKEGFADTRSERFGKKEEILKRHLEKQAQKASEHRTNRGTIRGIPPGTESDTWNDDQEESLKHHFEESLIACYGESDTENSLRLAKHGLSGDNLEQSGSSDYSSSYSDYQQEISGRSAESSAESYRALLGSSSPFRRRRESRSSSKTTWSRFNKEY